MHGIIGQLAHDPVRLAIAVTALIASVAIIRCLSRLAFFHSAAPREQESQPREAANRNQSRP